MFVYLTLTDFNRIFKLRLWLRIVLIKQKFKNLKFLNLLIKYICLNIFCKFSLYSLYQDFKKKSINYFDIFYNILFIFSKLKKIKKVNALLLNCFSKNFFFKKNSYKLQQTFLIFFRKLFKSLFFVKTLFLNKFLVQQILMLYSRFSIFGGLNIFFNFLSTSTTLIRYKFLILELKNLSHIYKFKKLLVVDSVFFYKQKFRNFVKNLIFNTGVNVLKLRKIEFFKKSKICILKSFYKLLDIYWLRLFIEKFNCLNLSFILFLFKWGRWFKFRCFENYKYTSYLPWCLYSLVFIAVKMHLIKNVINFNYFWDYSNRWHFEIFIFRFATVKVEKKIIFYFYTAVILQFNIKALVKNFLINVFNIFVLISRQFFEYKRWKLNVKRRWALHFGPLYLRKSVKRGWRGVQRQIKKLFFFFKTTFTSLFAFNWFIGKLISILDITGCFTNVVSSYYLSKNNSDNKLFFSINFQRSLSKLLLCFNVSLLKIKHLIKKKQRSSLLNIFYKIIIFLRLFIKKNHLNQKFSIILSQIHKKITFWLLEKKIWLQFISKQINMPWIGRLEPYFIDYEITKVKLVTRWKLWRIFKKTVFKFRKGQSIKLFFQFSNILCRYYNFFYKYKINLLWKPSLRSFVVLLECKLEILIYRLGLAINNIVARNLIINGFILVDDFKIIFTSFFVKLGSTIRLNNMLWGKIFWCWSLRTVRYNLFTLGYIEKSLFLVGGNLFCLPFICDISCKKSLSFEKIYLKWLYWLL